MLCSTKSERNIDIIGFGAIIMIIIDFKIILTANVEMLV